MYRVCLSAPQTRAMVSLLHTIDGTEGPIDVSGPDRPHNQPVVVTVYRNGEPTSWGIASDGYTKEV